jgi:hypothetical protein
VNLVGACGPFQVRRSDIELRDLNHLREDIVERMMVCLGRIWTESDFKLALLQG